MTPNGYSLVRLADGVEVQSWSSNVAPPNEIVLSDIMTAVHCPAVGGGGGGYRLVKRMVDDPAPLPWQIPNGQSVKFDGTNTIVSAVYNDQPFDQYRKRRLNELAALRWNKTQQGVNIGGFLIPTDDGTLVKLHDIAMAAAQDSKYTANFKTSGGFTLLDAVAVNTAIGAVRVYIQACFDREAALLDQMNATTTVEQLAAIDITTQWPSQ